MSDKCYVVTADDGEWEQHMHVVAVFEDKVAAEVFMAGAKGPGNPVSLKNYELSIEKVAYVPKYRA